MKKLFPKLKTTPPRTEKSPDKYLGKYQKTTGKTKIPTKEPY